MSDEEKDQNLSGISNKDSKETSLNTSEIKMAEAKVSDPTAEEIENYNKILQSIKDENARKALMEGMKDFATTNYSGDFQGDLLNAKNKDIQKNVSMTNKVVAKIPKFGIDTKVSWDQLMVHLRMIQTSSVYTNEELKLILFQSFEGPPFDYMAAHPELFEEKTFSEVLDCLQEVFGKTRNENVAEMSTIIQGTKEKVDLYEARVLNAAGRLRPMKPVVFKSMIDGEGKKVFVKNDDFLIDKAKFDGQNTILETMMLTHFINGLRPEIRRQMKAEDFKSFRDAKSAAKNAERFLEQHAIHSLTGQVAAMDVNAMSREQGREYLKNMEEKGEKKREDRKCFRCGKPGHIARFCRTVLEGGERGRSPRKFSPGRGRSPERRSSPGRRFVSPGGSRYVGYPTSKGYSGRQGSPRRANSPRGRDYAGYQNRYPDSNFDKNCPECRQRKRSCSRHRRVTFSGMYRPRSVSNERRNYHVSAQSAENVEEKEIIFERESETKNY